MATNPSFRKFNFAQLDMAHEVILLANNNQIIVNQVKEFADTIVIVDQKVRIIDSLIAPQSTNNKGISADKQAFKKMFAQTIISISHPAAGYAASVNNQELEQKLKTSYSRVRAMRDTKIVSFAAEVITLVTPILPAIIETGITAATLDALALTSTQYQEILTTPRNAKVIRKQLTQSLSTKMEEVMGIIKRTLDRLAARFNAINQPAFALQYKAARKLQPYGNLHTRADVTVTMGDSNAPVMDAIVQINGTSLTGVTDKDGRCTISPTPIGSRTLTVTAAGFPHPVVTPAYTFRKGKATRITVSMVEFNLPQSKVAAPQNELVSK